MSARLCVPGLSLLRVAAVAVAAAGMLAGCHASPPVAASSSSVAAQPSVVPETSSTHTYTYKSKQQGCDLLDLDQLTATLGTDAGALTQPHYQETSVAYFARCDKQYGAPATRSLVSIQIMVVKSGSAQFFYDGLHTADAKTNTLSDVPGLAAQGAYAYTDPETGPHLTLYDGNLYLRVSIKQIVAQRVPANTITDLMTAIARNSMSAMAA